jgi:hypothetical protein
VKAITVTSLFICVSLDEETKSGHLGLTVQAARNYFFTFERLCIFLARLVNPVSNADRETTVVVIKRGNRSCHQTRVQRWQEYGNSGNGGSPPATTGQFLAFSRHS